MGYLDIQDVAHLLVRDVVIVNYLNRRFGDAARHIIEELRTQLPDIWVTQPDIHDVLTETLESDARTYRRFESDGAYGDTYHIDINGLGGVYFVTAPEFDLVGYFDSLDAAENAVYEHWSGVSVWLARKTKRRRPFGPRSKDAALPPRRRSRNGITSI